MGRAEKLLSITKAANLLGVHPLTLRNWAEKGSVPYYRTPGGHRRFKYEELLAAVAGMKEETAAETGLVKVARRAVRQAIETPPDLGGGPAFVPTHLALDDHQRHTMRAVGRKLLGLTIQYAAGNADESVLDSAEEIGHMYGEFTRANGMSISQIVSTFNFFRDTIIEVTFEAGGRGETQAANPRLYRRLSRFFNQVLLKTVEAAEQIEMRPPE